MKVLLASLEDTASVNIRDRLLEEAPWEKVDDLDGHPVRTYRDMILVERGGTHLYMEGVDERIALYIEETFGEGHRSPSGYPVELLVFLSRHSSEKAVRSLTVHPPGNYLGADHGGKEGMLPPSAPLEMTRALKILYREKKSMGSKDRTTYEVTHHGPMVRSPCFFIEIGSDESRWGIPDLARPIARALLSNDLQEVDDLPIAIGVGGGHYGPRFTDRAMRNKFAFGHMVPDHVLRSFDDIRRPIQLAMEATPGARVLFYHRSKANEDLERRITAIADDLGLTVHS